MSEHQCLFPGCTAPRVKGGTAKYCLIHGEEVRRKNQARHDALYKSRHSELFVLKPKFCAWCQTPIKHPAHYCGDDCKTAAKKEGRAKYKRPSRSKPKPPITEEERNRIDMASVRASLDAELSLRKRLYAMPESLREAILKRQRVMSGAMA